MKCRGCHERYAVSAGAMGCSDSPRVFLICIFVFAGLALLGWYLRTAYSSWFGLALLVWAALGVLFSAGALTTAFVDANKACPFCGEKNRIYPWTA